MALVPLAGLLADAAAGGHGLGAFNVICLEHAEAIAAGAERAGRPAVLQISQNAVRYHEGRLAPIAAAAREVARASTADLALHLDHVEDRALAGAAAGNGFGSLMFDASRLDVDANVAATREVVEQAHREGLLVEAELGAIGGKDGAHTPGVRTDPDEAVWFVEATGVDALAVAVGSSHAMTERTARLDVELVARLARAVPVPLVLHGSSGVDDASLVAAVRAGIVKVNIGTAVNVALTAAVRARLDDDPALVDPRRYLGAGREAMAARVAEALKVLAT